MDTVPSVDTEDVSFAAMIEEAAETLSAFSIPLYQDDNGRPALHGTGFFVKVGSEHFLVSAAHVLDTAKDRGLYFYSSPGVKRHLTGKLLRSPGRENRNRDLIDVAVLKLNGGAAPPYKEVHKFAIDVSCLMPRYLPRIGKSYVIIGFPASKGQLNPNKHTVTTEPLAYRSRSAEEAEYTRINVRIDTHIVLPLDLKKGYDPHGKCQRSPHWSHFVIANREPIGDRDNGARW